MKPNLGFYVQKINDIVQETEAVGETMNPQFEEIRAALDANKVSELSATTLTEIHTSFTDGVKKYNEMLTTVKGLKPTARVVGIHKKFERTYSDYVASCQAMVDAIDVSAGTVNKIAFDAAELAQDENTDAIAFCIQRMTGLLMK